VLEQSEVLPAASVAVAQNVVVLFADTVTPIPGEANVEALPLPATADVQVPLVYSVTVEPASALPRMVGVVLVLDGDAGLVPVNVGTAGAVLSCV
jgi:hypothetical protein